MKKTIFILIALLSMQAFGISPTINQKPTGDWWSGSLAKDTAWNWAKQVELSVEAGQQLGTGQVFYVDSGLSASGDGSNWLNAVITLDEAVNLCEADRGDIIYIAQGHTEVLGAAADEVDINIAGVTVIGLGTGELRPLFDYTGDVSGAFAIGADDVTVLNCAFLANVPDVNDAIEIEAGAENFVIASCRFSVVTAGTDEFLDVIKIAAGCDNGLIQDCDIEMGGGASQSAINTAGTDYLLIRGNRISGDYGIANIEDATTASIWITIQGNTLVNGTVGGTAGLGTLPVITLKSDTSALIINNDCFANVATPEQAIVAADGFLAGNTYNESEGVSGEQGIGLQVGKTYVRSVATTVTASPDQMFTVAGGPIEIVSLFGLTAADLAGSPGDLAISLDATAGAAWDRDFTTAVTVDTYAQGDVLRFTNAIDEGVLDLTANVGAGQTLSWFCSEGEIEQTTTSTGTGGPITWYMAFRPLAPGVTVTPAL